LLAADFIVPMQFVEVAFACCRFHSSDAVVFVSCFGRLLAGWLFCELRSELIESLYVRLSSRRYSYAALMVCMRASASLNEGFPT